MPLPENGAIVAPTPTPAFAAPTSTAFARPTLRIDRNQVAWTFCVNPQAVMCRGGKVVPALAKAIHEPGWNGNAARGHGPEIVNGSLLHMARDGWIPVPHTQPASAFGIDRATVLGLDSTYLDRHVGLLPDGSQGVRYSDAWSRPKALGSTVWWERDAAGFDEWLLSLWSLISPDGRPMEVQIQMACRPILSELGGLLQRGTPAAEHRMRALVAVLPPDRVPAAFRKFLTSAD